MCRIIVSLHAFGADLLAYQVKIDHLLISAYSSALYGHRYAKRSDWARTMEECLQAKESGAENLESFLKVSDHNQLYTNYFAQH